MAYSDSTKDIKLRNWFVNDNNHALLRHIELSEGQLRGLTSLKLNFSYPIAAIAGKNGAGKSTILAMICCAYHNDEHGFKLPRRQKSYYTFSDFFVQQNAELGPQGISITYGIAYSNWEGNSAVPNGVGVGVQRRTKNKGGKWNDYKNRVERNVAFLGIERIVPHSERSQSRSYSKSFKAVKGKGWEDRVRLAVGYILTKSYEQFQYLEHSRYNLPIVKSGDMVYSGFNMGAGESALFEIFSTLYSLGEGGLLVLDEIELGLHVEAQARFVRRLKDVCLETKTQVICTTHSADIFESLPPDARFFIECVNNKTEVFSEISSEYVFSKLAARNGLELEILVEDSVARSLLLAVLPASVRRRVSVSVIGSATLLARQLAANFVSKGRRTQLVIFDGDQRVNRSPLREHARKMSETENSNFLPWFDERIDFLPGDETPEMWLIAGAEEFVSALASALQVEEDLLRDILLEGRIAGKHNEFYRMAELLGIDREACLQHFANVVCLRLNDRFANILDRIQVLMLQ